MEELTYNRQTTALILIDAYNDFISKGGKVWDRLKGVAEAEKVRPPSAHRHGIDRTYQCGSHGSLCRRAWLRSE